MSKTMQEVFPMLRAREQVLEEIQNNKHVRKIFESWEVKHQEEFLDICSGNRGVKVLYDAFFKEIMNPDVVPERLEELLSLILQTKVKILKVLPNDSARIAAENSLLVLDIVVEMTDKSLANVEVQRIGYMFPGQRSACYSSDLLLRQYKRVRSEKGKEFKYQDIKKVYTIVFLEKSTKEFHKLKDLYLHHSRQVFDTGLKLELLQEYVFIALDNYLEKSQNNSCKKRNRLEAWLTFLSDDRPEEILRLIEEYPEFKKLYDEVYEMCRNMGDFMGLFSEELAILDSNTVEYMMDEMQREIDEKKELLRQQSEQLSQQSEQLSQKDEELAAERLLKSQVEAQVKLAEAKIAQLKEELAKLKK